jgi:hypothetical protein
MSGINPKPGTPLVFTFMCKVCKAPRNTHVGRKKVVGGWICAYCLKAREDRKVAACA